MLRLLAHRGLLNLSLPRRNEHSGSGATHKPYPSLTLHNLGLPLQDERWGSEARYKPPNLTAGTVRHCAAQLEIPLFLLLAI